MRACMIAYTFYEYDNRVRRYAETLVRQGHEVDVVVLREDGQEYQGALNGVNIYRVQRKRQSKGGKAGYLFRLVRFLLVSGWTVARFHARRPYAFVHVHSVPDFEVFAALIPKMAGARIILDIHDIVPEFYASKFSAQKDSWAFKALVWVERLSIAFSDHVIVANDIWRRRLITRSVKPNKCTTILNYPDPAIFSPVPRSRRDERLLFLYPGTINRHQGLDVAVRAFRRVSKALPHVEFHIYGGGPGKDHLRRLIEKLGLQEKVLVRKTVPLEEVATIMADADIGVIPKRNDSFGGEAFSTKILEFMCMGVPVIISRTRIDDYYFNEDMVQFFRPDDEDDLATCMLRLAQSPELRERLAEKARSFVRKMTWDKMQAQYLGLVEALTQKKTPPRGE